MTNGKRVTEGHLTQRMIILETRILLPNNTLQRWYIKIQKRQTFFRDIKFGQEIESDEKLFLIKCVPNQCVHKLDNNDFYTQKFLQCKG